jgi:hypothetical protein
MMCFRHGSSIPAAIASDPDKKRVGRESNQKVNDSARVMEHSGQEAALDARAQHGKHKDPQPVLRHREKVRLP